MFYLFVLIIAGLQTIELCQSGVVDDTKLASKIPELVQAIERLESVVAGVLKDNQKLKHVISDLTSRLDKETRLRKQLQQQVEDRRVLQPWSTNSGGDVPLSDTSLKITRRRGAFRSSNETIAFSSYMTSHVTSPGNLRSLVFDAIFTNEGNGYNHHMGVFVAPRGGLYVFTWTIRANGGAYFNTQLLVNGIVFGSMYTRDYYYQNSNSATAVVRVAEGIPVFIRTGPTSNSGDIISSFDGYSTFSGWSID